MISKAAEHDPSSITHRQPCPKDFKGRRTLSLLYHPAAVLRITAASPLRLALLPNATK